MAYEPWMLLLWMKRGRKRRQILLLSTVVLPHEAAIIAAHVELAADRGSLRVDRAAQVIRVDRGAPAFFVACHHRAATRIGVQQVAGHVVVRHDGDGEPTAHRVATTAIDGVGLGRCKKCSQAFAQSECLLAARGAAGCERAGSQR